MHIVLAPEYKLINRVYGQQKARRSGVYYMAHIDEGLAVMQDLGHSEVAQRAYCLRPLVQKDEDLSYTLNHGMLRGEYRGCLPHSWVLAMEYRAVANACLAYTPQWGFKLSALPEVNQMLVADKVQNRKDFEKHHADTHPQAHKLDAYFRFWLDALGVREDKYQELKQVITSSDWRPTNSNDINVK
jgi:hypothetical protein